MDIEDFTFQFAFKTKEYPFNFADCEIVDISLFDKAVVLKCEEIQKYINFLEKENEELKEFQRIQ